MPALNWAGPGEEANISSLVYPDSHTKIGRESGYARQYNISQYMYARSMRCVAVNYEVPMTLYSMCIWAKKISLFMSSIFRITKQNPESTLNVEIRFEIQKSTLKS